MQFASKRNYQKHLLTAKHNRETQGNNIAQQNAQECDICNENNTNFGSTFRKYMGKKYYFYVSYFEETSGNIRKQISHKKIPYIGAMVATLVSMLSNNI
jgi:hypothetical protein